MKILLTGANGYIGRQLLPVLIDKGHFVVCCVRNKADFEFDESYENKVQVIDVDFLKKETLEAIPDDIECAYYLIHSMSDSKSFDQLESISAINFRQAIEKTTAKQVIYLTGIVNSTKLSDHLRSRLNVETELGKGSYFLTSFRAGIIIGAGSASFEIMRDLVEKLPIMIAPRWLKTKCQPIAISNAVEILARAAGREELYGKNYDIAGDEVFTYKDMLLNFAKARGLKRYIFVVPVMTPKLSSYWLYFITSTQYSLATSLVDSMKVDVVARNRAILDIMDITPLTYEESISLAISKVAQHPRINTKKILKDNIRDISQFPNDIQAPDFGCVKDIQIEPVSNREACEERIWRIGGETGWYYASWLWRLRGSIDKLFGGVGIRRGRTSTTDIKAGDTLDFWLVIHADRQETRLLLYAEMKLPGEAWLEFKIENDKFIQTATFRPKGLLGRMYWYGIWPMHILIFRGMARKVANG